MKIGGESFKNKGQFQLLFENARELAASDCRESRLNVMPEIFWGRFCCAACKNLFAMSR
jgi:hypothetical protein